VGQLTNQHDGNLFIVDNSISGWDGLRYLREWTEIAKSFDIATGYFDIGALLGLDGNWQKLEKIRILMGAEVANGTRKALLAAVQDRATNQLNQSIEDTKQPNPFLEGVPAIVEALKSGQIECKVYNKDKFHAKTYITHGKLDVVGARALVGSSNFTAPGLTRNVELNVQIQTAGEVAQLQEWFNIHWNEAVDVSEAVIETITRHTRPFTPFDVYAKSLHEFFSGHNLTETEWDESRSMMFPRLDRYQKEAYRALIQISRQHGGAFLCDGVGLGKTFVGLMLIERMILHEGKRVVLFAPKAVREAVWDSDLKKYLPHVGGTGGGGDFSNLAVFNHTDLGRSGDFPERFKRITELADVVIIDEAHHFRNTGSRGDGVETSPSRYYRLFDLLDSTERSKQLFMLTATPINNGLSDFRRMVELFSRRDEAYFARTIGVNNLRAYFNTLERQLREKVNAESADASEHIVEAEQILFADNLFRQLVVQRSRSYAKQSQIQEHGEAAAFPERKDPQVAAYSIRKSYGQMLDLVDNAFQKNDPLFTLPMYYPLHWYKGDDSTIDPFEENRQKQVVGLIRTNFLKRFESSVASFELSCDRLLRKLLAFLEVHSDSGSEKSRLDQWKAQNADVLGYGVQRQLELWGDDADEADDEDVVPQELLDSIEKLSRDEFDVEEMISETFRDLDQLVQFLNEARKFEAKQDDKLQKLIRLLNSREMAKSKVLIFTEFADTARYLKRNLDAAGISGVEQVDSATKRNRAEVIRRFSPYYNDSSSNELQEKKLGEIRVLISTDVLSEGLNLQDASKMINYDIHWNPVRLMQRIGRVDRRMNPEIEQKLVADHPEEQASRGKVWFWNFLPPAELNRILSLYSKVTQKTLLISETLGIEGRKLLTPEDNYEALREFNQAYEGTRTAIEDLHLEYQELVSEYPDLESRLDRFPRSVFSGRKRTSNGCKGVFFCYRLPALNNETGEFSDDAGFSRWYLYDLAKESILEDPGEIAESIRSNVDEPRRCITDPQLLIDIRTKIDDHIKNSYLKRVDAPIGVNQSLICWMELNEG